MKRHSRSCGEAVGTGNWAVEESLVSEIPTGAESMRHGRGGRKVRRVRKMGKFVVAGSIAERKAEFIRLDAEVDIGHKMNVKKSIRAGELLKSIRGEVGYGHWMQWVKNNLPIRPVQA